jgi:UDP:flavonoid glycosyltransferase YjiC (YdhE family)
MRFKPLILFFPFELLSHYTRCITLAKDLESSFRIGFAASGKYGHLIPAGYEQFPVKHFDAERAISDAENFSFGWLNEKDIEAVFLSCRHVIQSLDADLVLGDTFPVLNMAAESFGVPSVSLQNAYMTRYYSVTRRLPASHPATAHLEKLPQNFADSITRVCEKFAMRQVHTPFRKLRKKYSLSQRNSYLHEIEGDLNLICDLPALFPLKPLPESFLQTRPLLYKSAGSPSRVRRSMKPLIIACAGSSGSSRNFDFLADPAFSQFEVITAGSSLKSVRAAHITNYDFLDLGPALSEASVMICHGGNGTIYPALSKGVPVLCATTHFEQDYNVRAIKSAGLGDYLQKDPGSIVDQVLYWSARKNSPVFGKFRAYFLDWKESPDIARNAMKALCTRVS